MKQLIKLVVPVLLAVVCMPFYQQAAAQAKSFQLALIEDHIDEKELSAIRTLLRTKKEFTVQLVSLKKLKENNTGGFTHIWYHRTDTAAVSKEEMVLKATIQNFVQKGGKLFLSMESMALLNAWGFEQAPLVVRQDTIRDEGFGRPLGFHAFKAHPVFNGLMGGAYVSKQASDHIVRKLGFFDKELPVQGKVIGIDWTYITFTEQNKLLLEYQVGAGKIIAAGAYLYYSVANKNKEHLEVFTKNVLQYLSTSKKQPGTYYWNYDSLQLTASRFHSEKLAPLPAGKWSLPKPSLSLQIDKPGPDFYDLVGRRILWMGKLDAGMEEVWIHPYMALRDFEAGIKLKTEDSIRWLSNIRPVVTVSPEFLVREYPVGEGRLKEIYAVSYDKATGVAHYEIEAAEVDFLVVRYASNLRYMWPYSQLATGSIRYGFDKALNAHRISGQAGELNTLVHYSSQPIRETATINPEKQQVAFELSLPLAASRPVNISLLGGEDSPEQLVQQLRRQQVGFDRIFEQSNLYYKKLLDQYVRFETPDSVFSQGYAWALARTDQFVQTTPGIGTALMAGFGTTARGWNGRHRISGRPGYAWYFGRDAQWSAMAINAYGDFATVREQLQTFIRFQDLNGKIYHELTSSGVAHYDASDATPLFITLAAHYLKYSGDTVYIRQIWPSLLKALKFCEETDTDKDGLIENTNVGHGWIEGGPLFGTHTEFYLAGCWSATLEAMAYMSAALGKEANSYQVKAAAVKKTIDRDFWNAEKGYFYNGKYKDGSYMDQSTGFATVPMYLNAVTDRQKSKTVMKKITGSGFSTDWGIRMLEENNPRYKPGSYHAGMVWPLYNGWGSLGAYANGMYKAGFQYIMNSLQVYKSWAPGSIEETLNGEIYKPNGVCSHQCWSETMVVQPAIEGMLGFEPDAVSNSIKLAPVFPWNWEWATIANLRMGASTLGFKMRRADGQTIFSFQTNSSLLLKFSPVFPLGTKIASVQWMGKQIPFVIRQEEDGLKVVLDLPVEAPNPELVIHTSGGMGALPVLTAAVVNQPSTGLKILEETVDASRHRLLVEGRPGREYTVDLYSTAQVVSIKNASLVKRKANLITLRVKMPASGNAYSREEILINY